MQEAPVLSSQLLHISMLFTNNTYDVHACTDLTVPLSGGAFYNVGGRERGDREGHLLPSLTSELLHSLLGMYSASVYYRAV